jgi:hypothetical protein
MFLNHVSDYISESSEKLTHIDSRQRTIDELDDFWNKSQKIIGLTVPKSKLNNISSIILCIKNAHNFKDEKEFERYRLLLNEEASFLSNY